MMARPGAISRAGGALIAVALATCAAQAAVPAVPPAGAVSKDRPIAPSSTERGAEPRAAERPERTEPGRRGAALPDLARLRAEYDRIREELFKARVRSQKASEVVYPARLDARLRWKGGPDFVIRKARLLLDGAELWDSADRAQTDDLIEVSARSVKPGPHALTVRLEIRPKAEVKGGTKTGADKLGYTAEHTFAIVVADAGITHLLLTGDEDGDPPEYEPELELEIETEK
ncbi:MAG: hypothetical protein ABUS79_07080 [Pseudomonadota bacterium]